MASYEYLIDTREETVRQGQKTVNFYMTVKTPFEGYHRMIYGIRIVWTEPGKEKREIYSSGISFSRELVHQLIRILVREQSIYDEKLQNRLFGRRGYDC